MPRTSGPSGSPVIVGERGGDLALRGMVGADIARRVETEMAGEADEAGMLARAIVVEGRRRLAGAHQGDRRLLARGHLRAAFEIAGLRPAAASMAVAVATWRGSPLWEAQASASSALPKP